MRTGNQSCKPTCFSRGYLTASLIAAAAVPAIGGFSNDWFEDIRVDRYYDLHGGKYGSEGGIGMPGNDLGYNLANLAKKLGSRENPCLGVEEFARAVGNEGYYFEQVQYFGPESGKSYGRIEVTEEWLKEFFRRHKGDTFEMWQERYFNYLDSLGISHG